MAEHTAVMPPRIDVLIPVYNGAKTVESAIASIQAQSVRDIRIVVVNDGSTDDSHAIIAAMAEKDDRIVLLDRANGGIVDALNAGLANCSAEFVARHDADDLAVPGRFQKQLDWFAAHPHCNAVSGAIIHIDERGREISPVTVPRSPDAADPTFYPQKEPYLVHPFLMVRRAAVQAVGGYRHVYHAEDTDLYWRMQEIGEIANMDQLLGYYRVHGESITSASTLNGRIAAVSSQLCGFSAIRRRAGRPDIAFPREAIAEYRAAGTLGEIVRLGARGLDAEEASRLAAATAAKLLELSSYRPYEIDGEDCAFIRTAILPVLPKMTAENRAITIRQLSGTAARLAAQGSFANARRLCPVQFAPLAVVRFAMRFAMPPAMRMTLRMMLSGRSVMAK